MGQTTFAQHVGATVRTIRARQKFSQQQVAADAGISVGALRKIERGQESMHTRTIEGLARGLHTTLEALVLEALGAHQQTADPLLYIPIPTPPGQEPLSRAYVERHVRAFLRRLSLLPAPPPPRT